MLWPSDPGRSVPEESPVVYREEFRRAALQGWERDQAKAGERPAAHPAESPVEQAAGQAQDWDYPVSERDCSDLDQDQASETPRSLLPSAPMCFHSSGVNELVFAVDAGVDVGRLQRDVSPSVSSEEDHPG